MGPNSSLTFHLSLSLLYCLGLGHVVAAIVAAILEPGSGRQASTVVDEAGAERASRAAQALSLRLGLGILVHALAVMTGLPLRAVLDVGVALAAIGLGLGGLQLWRLRGRIPTAPAPAAWILLGLVVTGVGAWVMLMDPLWANDARSIWLFHAKIIYYAGALRSDAGWLEPAISFSHTDYPKLMPILAATEMVRFGYWNEFLPKLGYVPPLACYLLALLAGSRGRASLGAAAVMIIAFLAGGAIIHDGYVDVYAALATAGALTAVLRWLRRGEPRDAQHALVLLGLGLATKEEGLLFAFSLLVGLFPFVFSSRVRAYAKTALGAPFTLVVLVLAVAPWALWYALARRWGLHSYFHTDSAGFARAWSRARSGSLGIIARSLLSPGSRWFDLATTHILGLLGAAGVTKAVALAASRRLQLPGLLCLLCGLCYFAVLCLVYLMTPVDYRWQLSASADRVMLVALGCALVFFGDALEDIEPGIRRWSVGKPVGVTGDPVTTTTGSS
jgi:hypothetical protein